MILITGGAGYIGSHFLHTYVQKHPGEEVVVVDNLSLGHKEAVPGLPNVHFVHADIGDLEAMRDTFKRFKNVECVTHFAANAYVGESQDNPPKYFRNNMINMLTLLEAMEEAGVRKFLFSSTCATFGNPIEVPISESHPQNPVNVYGMTKQMMEQVLQKYSELRGWSYVVLRYFNAAGASEDGSIGQSHEPETRIIPLTLQAVLGKQENLHIFGDDYDTPDGTCIRDYIHVNDLAEAHIAALSRLQNLGKGESLFFNLGTEYGASVKEIVAVCEKVTGRKVPVRISPRRAGDPPVLVANATRAKEVLGWTPKRNLEKIVETAWNWELNRRY